LITSFVSLSSSLHLLLFDECKCWLSSMRNLKCSIHSNDHLLRWSKKYMRWVPIIWPTTNLAVATTVPIVTTAWAWLCQTSHILLWCFQSEFHRWIQRHHNRVAWGHQYVKYIIIRDSEKTMFLMVQSCEKVTVQKTIEGVITRLISLFSHQMWSSNGRSFHLTNDHLVAFGFVYHEVVTPEDLATFIAVKENNISYLRACWRGTGLPKIPSHHRLLKICGDWDTEVSP
jgi:hypothetical protein